LIGRLFDPTQGEIRVDDKPIKEFNLNQLRKSIGYVPQEVFLFSDTIENNVAFGLDLTKNNLEAVEQATKDAQVYHNIAEFPKGFQTELGERGITLSGGQKQRLSIARALIKKPNILIFDDCLSAVDTQTEERILTNLKSIMKGRSSVIISHRVSSVKHCDQIIVLDDGKIVERGNHAELLSQKGVYSDLYEQQLLEEQEA
jgi:ATP-binding cassette subfamily B protein